MKRMLLPLLASFLLLGCNEATDYFFEFNTKPSTYIVMNDEVDSLGFKDSIKIGGKPIEFELVVNDEEQLNPVLEYDTTRFMVTYNDEYETYMIEAIREGRGEVTFIGVDSFNEQSNYTFELLSFDNLLPECIFTVELDGNRIISVDAENSYDRDKRFGGQIVEYEYNLNGYKFTSEKDNIYYTFGSNGNKLIKVRVKDNDNAWSEWKQQYISVE